MRPLPISLAALVITIAVSAASTPRKQALARYTALWEDSMMTSDPLPPAPAPAAANLLDDYTLASLCRIGKAWHVVLINKKQRDERVRLISDEPNERGFKVVGVANPGSRVDAEVELQVDGQSGTVRFESKFLQVRTATVGARTQPRGGNTLARTRPSQPPIPGTNARNVRRIPVPNSR